MSTSIGFLRIGAESGREHSTVWAGRATELGHRGHTCREFLAGVWSRSDARGRRRARQRWRRARTGGRSGPLGVCGWGAALTSGRPALTLARTRCGEGRHQGARHPPHHRRRGRPRHRRQGPGLRPDAAQVERRQEGPLACAQFYAPNFLRKQPLPYRLWTAFRLSRRPGR